jgi:SAM-dependent methyltransferase
MRDAAPSLLTRVWLKLTRFTVYPTYRRYLAGIGEQHPLHGIQSRLTGNASADPTEFFDHYDAFAAWAAQKIAARRGCLQTLDVGSTKMMNGILSAVHDVTSLVLADCGDSISSVRYVRHDVCDPLPFADASFDVFTSMVSLPLVGLARYGDRLDPDCLVNLVAELGRVMRPDGELLVSMCMGKNVLNFNNGWFFDMPTMERIFGNWVVVDQLVDLKSSPYGDSVDPARRFSKDTSVDQVRHGDYRVVFLQLLRRGVVPAVARMQQDEAGDGVAAQPV